MLSLGHNFSEIVLKSRQLAAATYLVSDFIPEGEFLRRQLRKESVTLLADVASRAWLRALERIGEIISLVEVGRIAGIISEMNSAVLKGEYQGFQEVLTREGSGASALPEDFFSRKGRGIKDTSIKDTFWPAIGRSVIKRTYTSVRKPLPRPISRSRRINANRRKVIEDILRTRGSLTIKDAIDAIKDCSEKTIQRELVALVREGFLRREGARRWSRYFPATGAILATSLAQNGGGSPGPANGNFGGEFSGAG